MTRADFVRMNISGPRGLEETLWLYLHSQGLHRVPLSYFNALLLARLGAGIMEIVEWLAVLLTRLRRADAEHTY